MNQYHDEHMRRLEADHDKLKQTSNQIQGQLIGLAGKAFASRGKTLLPTGGIFMEIFLRYNFGVLYLPPVFSLITFILACGLFFSGQALFIWPATDPQTLLWALSIFITSIVFLIPWVIHHVSRMRRWTDVSGQYSQYPGDAWLDYFNEWMQRRPESFLKSAKRALAWICADELRRDFIGETMAGIVIAFVLGWVCLDRYVTYFLLWSLFAMQMKRWRARGQKLSEKRKMNDARWEMERR